MVEGVNEHLGMTRSTVPYQHVELYCGQPDLLEEKKKVLCESLTAAYFCNHQICIMQLKVYLLWSKYVFSPNLNIKTFWNGVL